jgi:hypothetical protein
MIALPLRRPALLGLLILALPAGIPSLRAASPAPLCEPSPAIRADIDSLEGERFDRMPPGKARTARVERLRTLLRENPDDFFLHRALQSRILGTEEGREKLVEEYRHLAEEHPSDPRYIYLYGRALKMRSGAGSRAQHERSLELDPVFPWPYLGLATEYLFEPGKDPAKVRRYLKKFWDVCPDVLESYRNVGGADHPRFTREAAGRLRAILESRSDREAMRYYTTLWSLEFKIHPPPEHEAVCATIRKDRWVDAALSEIDRAAAKR